MEQLPENVHKIDRIVVFNLDSLYSGASLHTFFEEFESKIVLICASVRYGKKYGSFFKQFKKNLIRSGLRFVLYLSFHMLLYYPMIYIADLVNFLLGRPKKVYSLSQLAKKYHIPIIFTNEPNESSVIKRVQRARPDLIVSAYFDHVIRSELIRMPTYGVINIHTALLPDYKGPFPTLWPMIMGEKKIGATVHYVNSENLDTGPILKQESIEYLKDETILGLDCRLYRVGINLAKGVISEIEKGTARAIIQDTGEGRYLSYPTRADLKKLSESGIPLFSLRDFLKQYI